jgi:hypothetical protein
MAQQFYPEQRAPNPQDFGSYPYGQPRPRGQGNGPAPYPERPSVAEQVVNVGSQGLDVAERAREFAPSGAKMAEGAELGEATEGVGLIATAMASPEIMVGLAIFVIFLMMWWWNGTINPMHWWPLTYLTGDGYTTYPAGAGAVAVPTPNWPGQWYAV